MCFFYYFFSCFLEAFGQWFVLPCIGVGGVIWLFWLDRHEWTLIAGLGYLPVGAVLGVLAAREDSRALAWNSACISLLGIIGVIVALLQMRI